MNPYAIITLRTFTIWIMAAIINGILTGIYVEISKYSFEMVIPIIFGCGILSLLFSIPGFFIFWIVMLVSISKNIYGRALFRVALSAGFLLAALTGLMYMELLNDFFSEGYVISTFIVFSGITSIMMHFRQFKKIGWNISDQNFNQL